MTPTSGPGGSLVTPRWYGAFRVDSERVLFSTREYLTDNRHRHFTVSPDDRSFYCVRAMNIGGSKLIVVLNWFEDLKAIVKP